MSQAIGTLEITLNASGAVAGRRCITPAGAQATTQGEKVIGVASYSEDDTRPFPVVVVGTVVVEAGAAVAVGESLITDNLGRAIPATGALAVAAGAVAVTSTAANGAILQGADLPEFAFADALEAAAAAGEFIEVLLRR